MHVQHITCWQKKEDASLQRYYHNRLNSGNRWQVQNASSRAVIAIEYRYTSRTKSDVFDLRLSRCSSWSVRLCVGFPLPSLYSRKFGFVVVVFYERWQGDFDREKIAYRIHSGADRSRMQQISMNKGCK